MTKQTYIDPEFLAAVDVMAFLLTPAGQWFAAGFAIAIAVALAQQPYTPTAESATATRGSLGAMGLRSIPGGRSPKPTAAERRWAEVASEVEKWNTGRKAVA